MTTKAEALEALNDLRSIPIEHLPDAAINRLDAFINSVPEWQAIESANKENEVCGGYLSGSRWSFHHVWFDPYSEVWTDIYSDRTPPITHFIPLPTPPITGEK